MRVRLVVAAGLVIAFGVIVLLPPGRLVLDGSCAVRGVANRARAAVQGQRFWVKQLSYLDKDLAFARGWPDRAERMQAEMDSAMGPILSEFDAKMEEFYRDHPELRPSAGAVRADQLRAQANAIEAEENDLFMRRILEERATELERIRLCVQSRIDGGG